MKRTISCLLAALVLASCSSAGDPSPGKTEVKNDVRVEPDSGKSTDLVQPEVSNVFDNRPTTGELLESFEYCRESAENSLTCKYFIAKAICLYFDIHDFEKEDGTYMDFEEILPSIQTSSNWYRAGNASDQSALDAALDAVRKGRAAIAVSERETYGHVVLILPGEAETAPSWNGLRVPMVASFFMVPGIQPFVDNSIAYAWKTPDGIGIYIRK